MVELYFAISLCIFFVIISCSAFIAQIRIIKTSKGKPHNTVLASFFGACILAIIGYTINLVTTSPDWSKTETTQTLHPQSSITVSTPEPIKAKSLYKMINDISKKGRISFVIFGKKSDGSAIVWRVLTQNESSILLMSDKIILCERFDESGSSKWSTSTLRTFLNNDFLTSYLSSSERQCLISALENDFVSIPTKNDLMQQSYGFSNGSTNITRIAFADSGFGNKDLKIYEGGAAIYFTRTVASSSSAVTVLNTGEFGYADVKKTNIGVRPMILVDHNLIQCIDGMGTQDDPFRVEPRQKEM